MTTGAAGGKAVYVTSSLHNTAWSQGAHRKGGQQQPVAVAPVPGSSAGVYALRARRGRGFRAFVVEADDYMLRLELRFPPSHRARINNCELFAQVVAR